MTIRGVLVADPLTLCRETVAHRVCCGAEDHAASVTRTAQAVPPGHSRPIGTGSHNALSCGCEAHIQRDARHDTGTGAAHDGGTTNE